MYQSVMAQRQSIGSSGIGFAFALVTIKDLLPDKNICLAQDQQTGTQYQLGLDKRGQIAWPQVGDVWVIDRSLGHWALRCKVTGTSAPPLTGDTALMDTATRQVVATLGELGLVSDQTTSGTTPAISGSRSVIATAMQQLLQALDATGLIIDQTTPGVPQTVSGSRNWIAPEVQVILDVLAGMGVLDDQTTPETLPVGQWQYVGGTGMPSFSSPWKNFGGTYQTARYMIDRLKFVSMEGLVGTTAAVSSLSTIFVLPSDYAPAATQFENSYRNGSVAQQLEISSAGTVRINNIPASTTVSYMNINARFSTL